MPSVLLVGATGPTGLAILAQARQAGLAVRALAREPSPLITDGLAAEVVQGDVLRPDSLVSALNGVSVVVSALGTPLILRRVTLLSEGTRHLVDAMQRQGVPRLLCITGMGAGDSRGHGGFVYDRLILPTLLRQIYADKDRQERVVTNSGLEWTLVRPARLINGPPTGQYRVITAWRRGRMTTIARADVAHFIVGEVGAHRHRRETVNLSA